MCLEICSSYSSGAGVATYLARYIKGGPIGNSRLLSLENGQVTFKYRLGTFEGGDGEEQGVTQLDVNRFMRRVLGHGRGPPIFRTIAPTPTEAA